MVKCTDYRNEIRSAVVIGTSWWAAKVLPEGSLMGWMTFPIVLCESLAADLVENNSNNNHQITSKLGDTAGMFSNYHFCCPEVFYSLGARNYLQ
jgi:hypothetical protein